MRWWHEPLLHFFLVGAALFAADQMLISRDDDPNLIAVEQAVVADAKKLFRDARQRDPDAAELQALTQRWIDNQILYREGLALGVDRGDTMIHDRVVFKALMLLETGLKTPPADDSTLREWFNKNRVRYDEPLRLDFQEAVLSDDGSEAAIRAFVVALNAGTCAPVCACSRAGRWPTLNKVMAPTSRRLCKPHLWVNGAPWPHPRACG